MVIRLFALCLAVSLGVMMPASIYVAGGAPVPGQRDPGFHATFLRLASSQAMAQAEHQLLVDRHDAAGVTCAACHGGGAPTADVAMTTCITCHGDYAALADRTPAEPNPHRSHLGEIPCSSCHNVHKASVSFCDQCHSFGMAVP